MIVFPTTQRHLQQLLILRQLQQQHQLALPPQLLQQQQKYLHHLVVHLAFALQDSLLLQIVLIIPMFVIISLNVMEEHQQSQEISPLNAIVNVAIHGQVRHAERVRISTTQYFLIAVIADDQPTSVCIQIVFSLAQMQQIVTPTRSSSLEASRRIKLILVNASVEINGVVRNATSVSSHTMRLEIVARASLFTEDILNALHFAPSPEIALHLTVTPSLELGRLDAPVSASTLGSARNAKPALRLATTQRPIAARVSLGTTDILSALPSAHSPIAPIAPFLFLEFNELVATAFAEIFGKDLIVLFAPFTSTRPTIAEVVFLVITITLLPIVFELAL